MRYNSFSFLNKSARYIGVLVGAAMIAALGMPSAAQAQTPAAPEVTGTGDGTVGSDGTLTATWGQPLGAGDQDRWLLEYTEPGVAWAEATKVILEENVMMSEALSANDPRIHHGVWKFRVSYYQQDSDATEDGDQGKVIGSASALTDYLHGPPAAAPTGFAAYPAGPDARTLVWDKVTGAASYELRYAEGDTIPTGSGAPESAAWTAVVNNDVITKLKMGVDYTFELRARGASRSGVGDLHGPTASIVESMPEPTPTLPEWGALFLALLLVGGGAYIIRRRQAQALTPA